MNENEYINNNNTLYADSDFPMNKISESPELTKEQLEKMKEKIVTEIDKTTKEISYDDLLETAVYNSSDAVREQIKEEIKRRILSGEVTYGWNDKTTDEVAFRVLSDLEEKRREYLRSVANSKGNSR